MKTLKTILCVTFALIVLGIVGRADWSDQVIYCMPQAAYDNITAKLGAGCSDYDIAKEYISNKDFYDSLSF